MSKDIAVQARGLVKRYGKREVLHGVDLTVPAGSVASILGPNGAGKTTTVRILATLTTPDAGAATVAGHDDARQRQAVRRHNGLVGQYNAVDEKLTGRENLAMFSWLHHLPRAHASEIGCRLLEQFDLTDAADRPVKTYSGGMRRRLDIAASLILEPTVLFLDEPTAGLDPRSRDEVWGSIRAIADRGTSVILTTQYLDEADRLADQIVVIDSGRVVVSDTPQRLKEQVGDSTVEVVTSFSDDLDQVQQLVARVTGVQPSMNRDQRRLSVAVADGPGILGAVARGLTDLGVALDDIGLRRPTLDHVFFHYTGHGTTHADKPNATTDGGSRWPAH